MTDQLYLSLWLERSGRPNRLAQFEKMLRLFPFSQREQPQTIISVHAVDSTEPPLLERSINGPVDVDEIVAVLQDYQGDDLAFEIETWWDLWIFQGDDWTLAPVAASLSCFSPDFDNGTERETREQEDLRIDFNVDSHYLPQPDLPGSARLIESNIRSLIRLVHELDSQLNVSRRLLETESGGNFADRLRAVLAAHETLQ